MWRIWIERRLQGCFVLHQDFYQLPKISCQCRKSVSIKYSLFSTLHWWQVHSLILLFVYLYLLRHATCFSNLFTINLLMVIVMVVFPFSTENNYFTLLLTIFINFFQKQNSRSLFETIFYPNLVLQHLVDQPQQPGDQVPD